MNVRVVGAVMDSSEALQRQCPRFYSYMCLIYSLDQSFFSFITDDPGRQTVGSFHPINDAEWESEAYCKDSPDLHSSDESFDGSLDPDQESEYVDEEDSEDETLGELLNVGLPENDDESDLEMEEGHNAGYLADDEIFL